MGTFKKYELTQDSMTYSWAKGIDDARGRRVYHPYTYKPEYKHIGQKINKDLNSIKK